MENKTDQTKVEQIFEEQQRIANEDIKQLKEKNKNLEDIHSGDMKIVKMLKEKWNEEQEKNKKLKDAAFQDVQEVDVKSLQEEINKLKEENKNLKEELEEAKCSMPDLCVDCDCLFDLHSAMNKITCEEDECLRKKYDEYFGSDKDRGDLCKQCIREELP